MTTLRQLTFLAALLALAAAPARAADDGAANLRTTADLQALCKGGAMRLAQCNGFIAGAGLLYLKLVHGGAISPWVCAPSGTGLEDARTAFLTWAAAHPEQGTSDVIDGFWQAMGERWPCRS